MPKKKTQEEFIKEVNEKYGDEYTVLGKYIDTHTPILLKHNICGNEWNTTTPCDFLKKKPNKCPNCSHPSRKKTNEEFLKEVKNKVGDEYTFLESYKTNKEKIKCKHNKCGYEWKVSPNLFLSHETRCPKCSYLRNESKGSLLIKEILIRNKINFEQEVPVDEDNVRNDQKMRFDFYLKELNTVIEFDGEFHYVVKKQFGGAERLREQQKRDLRKNKYCEEKGINLIRISYLNEKNILEILKEEFKYLGKEII